MIDHIHWLGHASFRLTGEKIVYIDPWKITGGPKADLILITHDHYDHFSPTDIEKLRFEDTVIVGPAPCASTVQPMRVVRPLDVITAAGLTVEATAAYNIRKQFHPRGEDKVGYVITLNGVRIYHSGDTDRIPEMAEIQCDVALLPVSGKYVMNAEEAAAAAADLNCKKAVPMHWGEIIGSYADAERFRDLAACEVVILPKSK